ncbi:Transcription termination/antitermination protein NusA [Geodia barretti]|uniref:Transcription termination/antitermination protein NusA n=1 Tax=Geodia barretti TaxID=519541 RepID=A0AA35RVT8_GEOBA|nr:Transcription termination/antitermination protein NusA [Geodia barretti]
MKSDFMMALNQLSAERGLRKELVLDKVEVALATAFRRDRVAGAQNLTVKLNPNTGDISIFPLRSVVEEIEDPETQIALSDALRIQPWAEIGSEISEDEEVAYDTSRISAQTARQVLMQGLREAEREKIFEEYSAYQGEIISGSVESIEKGPTVFVNLNPHQAQSANRARGVMRPDNQVGSERYRKNQSLKVLLVEVQQTTRGPEVVVSRAHRDLLRRLMESEVPEIGNGTVEIRAIARDPGIRSKVAVSSHQDGVDPVGSCIGLRGNRIQSVVNELQGEKIDVIEWDPNPRVLIGRALSPADVGGVELDADENTAYVVVPESQMSLAIGRDGQNARLAARLSGWRLDIKNIEQWETLRSARAAEAARTAAAQAEADEAARIAAAAAEASAPATPETEPVELAPVAEVIAEALADIPPVSAAIQAEIESLVPEEVAVQPESEPQPAADPIPAQPQAMVVEPLGEVAEVAEPEIDEDALLDALIAQEEAAATPDADEAVGLSVDALESLTIDDVVDEDEEEFEEEEEEEPEPEMSDLLAGLPNLAPDAGKIRFAEDIVGDFRGGDRRRRRGGGARRGGNVPGARGPGPRRR